MYNLGMYDQQSTKLENYEKVLVVIGVVVIIWAIFCYLPNSHKEWYGLAEVSLFPDNAESKNYRLDAPDTRAERNMSGLFSSITTYTVSTVNWPDGGDSKFDDCTITQGSTSNCITTDGTAYRVEITTAPDQPTESDTSY